MAATTVYTAGMASESTKRICDIITRIPRGKVTSYGSVAALAGLPNGARQVVRILHSSAEKEALPWHRLLRKDGSIALPPGGGLELQRALLKEEGVEVSASGRVDLSRFGWTP
jgi:methylated-DNA-protein-cysteine methyltransferase related protein